MTDPRSGRPAKGTRRRKTMIVNLAVSSLKFDTIAEYVKAYNELIEPKDKIVALTELMKYQFPKIKDVDYKEMLLHEMEALETEVDPGELETSELLNALNVTPIKR